MKKAYLIFCVLFFVLLAALGASSLASANGSFSELENRTLKTPDDIEPEIMSGKFQSDLEDMLSDQFPLRYACVTFQTKLKLALGRHDVGGAYIANGRLFQKITEADVDYDDISAHAARYKRASDRAGIKLTAVPVPSAGCVLPELLPDGAAMYDFDRAYSEISGAVGAENTLDLRGVLSGNGDLYYRTDHHWTVSGARAAYLALCDLRGSDGTDIPAARTAAGGFFGSLYSKAPGAKVEADDVCIVDVPDGVTVTADGAETDFYDLSALEQKDKYKVFQSGNHGITVIDGAGTDGVLLIVKDSFANSLVPYLVYDYKRIVMIDERFTTLDLAAYAGEIGADEIMIVKEAAYF